MKYLFLTLFVLSSCTAINQKLGLSDDNFLEETLEYGIKFKTGLDVDLTPESQE